MERPRPAPEHYTHLLPQGYRGGEACICTWSSEAYEPLARLTYPTLQLYARLWGYGIPILKIGDYMAWEQLRWVYRYLDTGKWEYVAWIDADAMILNPSIPLRDVLGDHKFVITEDLNGLNRGVFIARACPEVMQYLMVVLTEGYRKFAERRCVRPENDPGALGILDHDRRAGPWAKRQTTEQDALEFYAGKHRYKDVVTVLPQRSMNAYLYTESFAGIPNSAVPEDGQYQPGDFILHLAGIPMERKLQIAEEKCAYAAVCNSEAERLFRRASVNFPA